MRKKREGLGHLLKDFFPSSSSHTHAYRTPMGSTHLEIHEIHNGLIPKGKDTLKDNDIPSVDGLSFRTPGS